LLIYFIFLEFPAFLDYFRQIKEVDAAYASKCIAHWRLFMMGPPNKPNKDEFGLIYVIINHYHLIKSIFIFMFRLSVISYEVAMMV
jgi:hypothetical protein